MECQPGFQVPVWEGESPLGGWAPKSEPGSRGQRSISGEVAPHGWSGSDEKCKTMKRRGQALPGLLLRNLEFIRLQYYGFIGNNMVSWLW